MHIPVIERIDVTPFQIPFATFLRSGQQMHVKKAENVLVRVTADDGTVGIAEANAFAELFGESQASIVHAISDWIAPRVKGIALSDFERLWHPLDIMRGNNSAKAAVDMAVHDALAQVLGLPMYRMLGGYRDRVPLTWIIGQGTVDEMLEEGAGALGRGFKSFKIKIGLDPAKDVKVIAALRKQLGDATVLYVDANQGYSYADAIWALPRMETQGIVIIEDPIQNWDVDGRRKLGERLKVPMLGDECARTPEEVKREIDLGILRMINLKTPRSGYYASRKIVHLAEQAGFVCMMGTMLETDVGALAAAHFAAAFKAFTYPAEITYWQKMEGGLLTTKLPVENGVLHLSDRPGIGIEIDEDKLAKYRVTI
jgi:L-alanine-DL-glutamate epimerase-like enolase superfamily enzyme